ncbi:DUF4244 domain-containing protein [Pseudonocardia lutea]|uniref:DUF4244 domain-containing protein n=1 Tax=Pseudonocardia lutea TaxID=2172015 RepID=A0ABW1II14_9PSEU
MSLPAPALPRPEPRRDPNQGPRSSVLRCPEPAEHRQPPEHRRSAEHRPTQHRPTQHRSPDEFRSAGVPEAAAADPGPPDRIPPLRRVRRGLAAVLRAATVRLTADDRGMSTVEYAIGTLAAAAFAAVLYTVISGDSIVTALTQLVQRALSVTF